MAERVLNFVNAGEQDVSEVKISTGVHPAGPASPQARISYTISYPGTGALNPLTLKEEFAKAADAIIDDANARGVTPGNP